MRLDDRRQVVNSLQLPGAIPLVVPDAQAGAGSMANVAKLSRGGVPWREEQGFCPSHRGRAKLQIAAAILPARVQPNLVHQAGVIV